MCEKEIRQYNSIISIWERWDKGYWDSFHFYIIVISLLFAGYSQIINKINIAAVIVCFTGFIISIFWFFILHRKYAHILIAENEGRKLETKIFTDCNGCFTSNKNFKKGTYNEIDEALGCRKFLTKISSGLIVSFFVPLTFTIIWLTLMIITTVHWIIKDVCPFIISVIT